MRAEVYVPPPEIEAALLAAGWKPPERVAWSKGCTYVREPHYHLGGRCEGPSAKPERSTPGDGR